VLVSTEKETEGTQTLESNMIFYDLFCIKVKHFVINVHAMGTEIFNNFIKYEQLLSSFRISHLSTNWTMLCFSLSNTSLKMAEIRSKRVRCLLDYCMLLFLSVV